MPSSAGGSLKINHPPPASTERKFRISRKNARSASGSLLYNRTCVPVIMQRVYADSHQPASVVSMPATGVARLLRLIRRCELVCPAIFDSARAQCSVQESLILRPETAQGSIRFSFDCRSTQRDFDCRSMRADHLIRFRIGNNANRESRHLCKL